MLVFTAEFYRECLDRIDYEDLIPPYRFPLQRCIERGCPPGEALQRVLENDLQAILFFDSPMALQHVFAWVNRELPSAMWGTPQKVKMWMRLAHAQWGRGVSAKGVNIPARRPHHNEQTEQTSSSDRR